MLGSKNEEHASYKQYLKKLIMGNISDVVSSRPAAINWPKKVSSSKTCIIVTCIIYYNLFIL